MSKSELLNELNDLLADHAVYYQKLRNYHWNVTGPAFFQLHDKFEQMYLAAQTHVDSIAERILGLGGRPYSTMGAYLEASTLSEDAETPDAQKMVRNLREDLDSLLKANRAIKRLAEEEADDTTANLLDDIGDAQEMDAWMLRAWLG